MFRSPPCISQLKLDYVNGPRNWIKIFELIHRWYETLDFARKWNTEVSDYIDVYTSAIVQHRCKIQLSEEFQQQNIYKRQKAMLLDSPEYIWCELQLPPEQRVSTFLQYSDPTILLQSLMDHSKANNLSHLYTLFVCANPLKLIDTLYDDCICSVFFTNLVFQIKKLIDILLIVESQTNLHSFIKTIVGCSVSPLHRTDSLLDIDCISLTNVTTDNKKICTHTHTHGYLDTSQPVQLVYLLHVLHRVLYQITGDDVVLMIYKCIRCIFDDYVTVARLPLRLVQSSDYSQTARCFVAPLLVRRDLYKWLITYVGITEEAFHTLFQERPVRTKNIKDNKDDRNNKNEEAKPVLRNNGLCLVAIDHKKYVPLCNAVLDPFIRNDQEFKCIKKYCEVYYKKRARTWKDISQYNISKIETFFEIFHLNDTNLYLYEDVQACLQKLYGRNI
jgi:hypothetical protein